MKIIDSIKLPFHYLKLEKNRSCLWVVFTILIGLLGIVMNIIAHLSPECGLFSSIKQEFAVNSFYTFSIVLITSSFGSFFMQLEKNKMLLFTEVKTWLMIVFGFIVFTGAILSMITNKIPHCNYVQLVYFALSIILSLYTFCVTNMEEYSDYFKGLQAPMTAKDKESLAKLASKAISLTQDKKGVAL